MTVAGPGCVARLVLYRDTPGQPLSLLHCHQREKLETGLTHANYVNNYSAFEMPAAGSDWSDHFLQSPEPGEMTQALSGFPHQARGDKV